MFCKVVEAELAAWGTRLLFEETRPCTTDEMPLHRHDLRIKTVRFDDPVGVKWWHDFQKLDESQFYPYQLN
jgi:hypothetical protein